MSLAPNRSLVRYDAALYFGGADCAGLFCASPTVLEAINHVLRHRGMPLLWAHPDGTIGPADPLLMQIEFNPFPFVN